MPSATGEKDGRRRKEAVQTHLADDPAVVLLRVPRDPLQKGHQRETVCLRHADVYDSETWGVMELRVLSYILRS